MKDSILTAFEGILRSRKFWTALITAVITALVKAFNLSPQIGDAVMTLALALIATWTVEDAARSLSLIGSVKAKR